MTPVGPQSQQEAHRNLKRPVGVEKAQPGQTHCWVRVHEFHQPLAVFLEEDDIGVDQTHIPTGAADNADVDSSRES